MPQVWDAHQAHPQCRAEAQGRDQDAEVAGHKEGAAMTSLLVTGGTGTVGSAVVRHFLKGDKFDRIAVFSRDEFKQSEMRKQLKDSRLRFFLGDVRDAGRLRRAMEGIDTVVHAAAMKQIDACAYNPAEAVRTNVDGTINLIEAAIDCNVRRVVAISTDKAVEPVCLYGATKLAAEGLILHAKSYVGHRRTSFAVCRLGNIAYSRGSVLPFFDDLKRRGESLPVTSLDMTRYWVSQEQACILVDQAVFRDGEVFTPDPVSFRMSDLVKAYDHPYHIVGLRDQERLFEKLDSERSSANPSRWMTVEEIRKEIRA
jgi:UDP-N-acetylglucosamine 4,6-dehydratase